MKETPRLWGVHSIKPLFGDHLLISLTLRLEKEASVHSIRRDWRKYSKDVLLRELALTDWTSDVNNVKNM